jgi:hypothetical protein
MMSHSLNLEASMLNRDNHRMNLDTNRIALAHHAIARRYSSAPDFVIIVRPTPEHFLRSIFG